MEAHNPPAILIPRKFGSTCEQKQEGRLRVFYQNVNGVPKESWLDKNEAWTERLHQYEADVALFSEVNVNWPKTRSQDSLQNRLRQRWTQSRVKDSFNRHARAAVIGAGPSGIQAAGELLKQGFQLQQ